MYIESFCVIIIVSPSFVRWAIFNKALSHFSYIEIRLFMSALAGKKTKLYIDTKT